MSAIAGSLVTLEYMTGSPLAPVDLAGLQAREFKINNTPVDVTTADSSGRWQELLPNVSVKSIEISGSGIFKTSSAGLAVKNAALNGTALSLVMTFPGDGAYAGSFYVDGFTMGAPHDNAATFSCAFRSNGAITYTAET